MGTGDRCIALSVPIYLTNNNYEKEFKKCKDYLCNIIGIVRVVDDMACSQCFFIWLAVGDS